MRLKLKRVGNSSAILITKEMKRYLDLETDELEIRYERGTLVLSKPTVRVDAVVREIAKRAYQKTPRLDQADEPVKQGTLTDEELEQLRALNPLHSLFDDFTDEDFDKLEESIRDFKKMDL